MFSLHKSNGSVLPNRFLFKRKECIADLAINNGFDGIVLSL